MYKEIGICIANQMALIELSDASFFEKSIKAHCFMILVVF